MSVVENEVEHIIRDPAADNGGCSPFPDPPVSPRTHDCESSASESDSNNTAMQHPRKFPYVVGFTTTARRQQPLEPFGLGYKTECPLIPPPEDWKSLSKAEYCSLRHVCDDRSLEDVKTLNITAVIRTGENRGAQLVVINDDMVAKIYDPFYYDETDELSGKEDIIFNAFSDYSREAAAFRQIQTSPAAREVTPAFHGTWTTAVDTWVYDNGQVQKRTRQVPLILMEYIRGETMRNIEARALPERVRSRILKKVIDTDIIMFHAGIGNSDYCPRNIMITGLRGNLEDDALDGVTITAIDFNVATVRLHPKCAGADIARKVEEEYKAWAPKLLSPMIRWYNSIEPFAWDDWCPNGDGEPELWLCEQYHNDERYIPVIWDPSQPDVRPERVEFESGSETSVDSGLGLDMAIEKGENDDWKNVVEFAD
ncbi:uncharacterized protein J4E87_001615 [Alternaria ethzedia]|uniref:uncharacterized protein n=1 Tax=Alternaria ethzedia TaxID=181014 RepID=UPI0020C49641|nr:uncharacterized protein J4E87_001615 [Alternaria ethzedia]KAI4632144.1 hypothetical protein J4E87_001615 [Alternaria ethzedia]